MKNIMLMLDIFANLIYNHNTSRLEEYFNRRNLTMKRILLVILSLCLLLPAFAGAEPPIEYQIWNLTDGELICTYTTDDPYRPAPPTHIETTVITTTTVSTTIDSAPPRPPRPCEEPMDELHVKLYGMRNAALKQLKKFKNRLKEAETGWTYVKGERVLWGWARYIHKIYLRNDETGVQIKIYQCCHKDGRVYYTTDYYVDSGKYDDDWVLGRGVDSIIDTLRHRIK